MIIGILTFTKRGKFVLYEDKEILTGRYITGISAETTEIPVIYGVGNTSFFS